MRVEDVRLVVDADGPVLVEVVAGARGEVVLGPAEGVVGVERQAVATAAVSTVSCSEW